MKTRKLFYTGLLFVACFAFLTPSTYAKDEWLQVRTKNFFLIGNASEKDIRKAATKLEQFRETFRLVFRSMNLDAPVPTNVVVFKSDASFKPFKPRRGDGKADNLVAGYFQPGEDVNYVTLSTEGEDARTYETIFHEYVHFIIETNYGKYNVPSWFNEGLAEYYSTFQIEEDIKVKLGLPDGNHLELLAQSKLMPLSELFSNSPRNYGGGHSRSIFYAQSWALIHYLVQTGKGAGLDKFLTAALNNKPAEQSFREAFGVDYADMEKELRKYVGQRSFKYHALTFKNALNFDTQMQVSPLTEADSNAYLGDLLYHTHRVDDAEPFLRTALSLQPDSSMANTSLGMVKVKQRKYAEAKQFLDKAIAQNQKNHLAYFRYAELLVREGQDEFGYTDKYEPATAARIREMLKKAIAINPSFTESYELFAFVNLVNNEQLDEAAQMLVKALKINPGNMRYAMRIAEIYLRQEKYKEAAAIAEKLAKNSDDGEVRARAERLAADIKQHQDARAEYDAARKRFEEGQRGGGNGRGSGDPRLIRRGSDGPPATPEQVSKRSEELRVRAINRELRQPEAGERRVLGRIVKIECKAGVVVFSIKTDTEAIQLLSKDFQGLSIETFMDDGGAEVGCTTDLSRETAVVSYRPHATPRSGSQGDLTALAFVPATFWFIDIDTVQPTPSRQGSEEAGPPPPTSVIVEETVESPRGPQNFEEQRRAFMLKAIAEGLRKPAAGEKREIGFIEKSECTSKAIFFYFRTPTQVLKISNATPEDTFLRTYTPEGAGVQVGCNMKAIDIPVVFVYTVSTDKKKVAGDLVSIEFVPKSFKLEN